MTVLLRRLCQWYLYRTAPSGGDGPDPLHPLPDDVQDASCTHLHRDGGLRIWCTDCKATLRDDPCILVNPDDYRSMLTAMQEQDKIALWLRNNRQGAIDSGRHAGRGLGDVVIGYMSGGQ